jgi:hypothetical protein
MPEGFEQVSIGESAAVQSLRLKQLSIERSNVEDGRKPLVTQHVPQDSQAVPKVFMVGEGTASIEKISQASDAVVLAIECILADEPAILGDQKKQEAIDEPQELPIKGLRGEAAFLDFQAEVLIGWMAEKPFREDFDAALNAIS